MQNNIISSPLTLANQLAILYEGSAGQTREQIKKLTLFANDGQLMALKELQEQYDCLTKGKITTKNGLFLDESFRPKANFYHALKRVDSDMFKVNFAQEPELARVLVDSWSSNFSENPSAVKLPEGSVRPSTSMMMMSSAEFEAKWKIKFNNGGLGGFLMLDGTTKVVKMMDATYPMQHIISCTGKQIRKHVPILSTNKPLKKFHKRMEHFRILTLDRVRLIRLYIRFNKDLTLNHS